MKYIGDVEKLDIPAAKNLAEKGLDVFNAKDDFFNYICHNYKTDGKDIIINDRRTDIFQSAKFCQNGCTYIGMNFELMTANCKCDSSVLQSSSINNTNNENKFNNEESLTFKNLTNSFIANLFDFNLDVFKCYNLVFNLKIFNGNIGFYCMASMLILQITFLFIFLIKRLYPLKKFMLIFQNNNNNIKASIHFPPPKIQKKIGNNIYSFNERNNEYGHNLFNDKECTLNSNNSYLKLKNMKFNQIKSNEESNYINNNKIKNIGERQIIFENKFKSIININSPMININGLKEKK